MYKVENILPNAYDTKNKSNQVEEMFDEIAPKYDSLNHTLSLNLDKQWRKKGINAIREIEPQNILDIATGTGDLAIEAYRIIKPKHILGIDISEKMMAIAKEKVKKLGIEKTIEFQRQNCCQLNLPSNSFDAAIVAFGVRNFESLDKGLSEILRVLKPNGRLMILELSTPEKFPTKQGYKIYSKIIPMIGKIFSKSQKAYKYLPKSISAFPQNSQMTDIMKKNGFENTIYQPLSMGICTMYIGDKKDTNRP